MSDILEELARQFRENEDKPVLLVDYDKTNIKSIRWVFKPELYTLKQVKEAFWAAFHKSGEMFFDTGGWRTDAEVNESTAHHYCDLEKELTGTFHGVLICKSPNCENPVVYLGEPHYPYCETCMEDDEIKRKWLESQPEVSKIQEMQGNTEGDNSDESWSKLDKSGRRYRLD